MEHFTPKYRRDPNEMVHSIFQGPGPGGSTVTRIVKKSPDGDYLEATQSYGTGLERGVGGLAAIVVMGGMVTTRDEMEYIAEARRQKTWVPKRTNNEIAKMCQHSGERHNEAVMEARKRNPNPPKKKPVTLYLPVGYRMAETSEPGLKILAKV